jgi:alpha-beta hydrolase superfamily lysophospholipase
MAYVEELIAAADGAKLYARRRESPASRAEIIIVHGFGEHSGRYSALSEHLACRGFTVTAYDHRGHGQSAGLPGHIEKFSHYEDDLDNVVSAVRRRSDQDVFLVGHSMGGLVALRYLARAGSKISAAVISAPLLGFATRVPAHKALIGRVSARLAPRFRMNNEIDPMVLSRDKEICLAYAKDPLVGHLVSARWFVEAMRGMDEACELAPRISSPVLVMHGTEDKLASLSATQRVFGRIASADKELIVYQGFYHELFNEPEKKDLYELTANWIQARNGKTSQAGAAIQ